MLNKKYYILLVFAFVMLIPTFASAQTQLQVVNTFSPYTMYGLGELQTQGTLQTRSMGGAGVAQRSPSSINLLNPASYSMAIRRGVLFDFGLEGSSYFSTQNVGDVERNSTYTTANFHDIALQLPIVEGLGFGFSVTPYSSVGYYQSYASIDPSLGYLKMINTGSGDITEVKFGVGWIVAKNLSIGFAAQYYWGSIDRYFTAEITSITTSGTALSTVGDDNISVSKLKGQAGVQWSPIYDAKRMLTIGATYDIGGELSPRSTRVVTALDYSSDVYAQSDTTTISMVLPRQLSLGLNYSTSKWVVAADYTFQNWGDNNDDIEFTGTGVEVAYNNVSTIKMGLEYTPRRTDSRHYYRRINYRMGARMGGYQYTFGGEELSTLSITAGAGLPINLVGISKIDLGVEWGTMGTTKSILVDSESVGLVKQNQIKFSLGFTLFGDDYWFQRPQIN
ncbi:MAG: hypothetical protein SNH55_05110 [Rikenellaceae bacterium]